jgi:hypothetical protein
MNRRPRFFHGALAAGALAVLASVTVVTLTPILGAGSVIRCVAPLLALAYLLYLFRATRARTGRVVTLTAWAGLAFLAWWIAPPLPLYLLLHVGAIWLIRSLYAYSSLIPAMMDFALSAIGVLTFSWAFMRTGSVFMATWCFFLVQALWAWIPRNFRQGRSLHTTTANTSRFERARREADAALRQLFSQ